MLVAAATVTTWAVGMLFASLAFWAPKLDLHSLFGNVWQLARYPADVYARPLRRVFTYVLPLAVVASAPARVLARPADALLVLGALVTTAAAVLVWRTGLRRYTGASSWFPAYDRRARRRCPRAGPRTAPPGPPRR
ncbi:ABC-2 family transporter protein [Amycolatopsis sp. NPDC049253]|uniref:ABC-2 family transporter protein n=1 Tax=Amycolatopsis sp. NPDC049253 TaxID=3155274 RepID=UPI00342472BE